MNLPKRLKGRTRERGIVARDLIVADFTLQFARQFALPCKKGINIRMLLRHEGVVDVSVLILDLGRRHNLFFCIQEKAEAKTWEVACLYDVRLTFWENTPESDLPAKLKHTNRFRAKRIEAGRYEFDIKH